MKYNPEENFSLKARLRSFKYAFTGICEIVRGQHNFRIHLLAVILVVPCGFLLQVSVLEWTILILCIGLVLSMETINSVIEKTIDLVSPGENKMAGKIKDMAAAAVLIVALCSALIGFIIFIPKIIDLLKY